MDKDRRAVFLILKDIEKNEAYSNLAVKKFLAGNKVDNPPFIREMVYGIIRNRMLLDYNIGLFLTDDRRLKPADKILLRMGFYQLARMDSVRHYAAINETVELAKRFAPGREKFINAVLRSFLREGHTLTSETISVKYSCHESIVRHFEKRYGRERMLAILENAMVPPPVSERTNLNGSISIQGLSSQTAVKKLDPKPGERLLDLCAAPGGKSIYAAQLMNNTGEIVACDLYEHRVELMNKEAQRTGSTIISTRVLDATKHIDEFDDSFDAVICDVPCSGLGTIAKKPEIKLKDLDALDEQLHLLYITQREILDNAASYVKKGGRILYSTCTLNPDENELQTARFLGSHAGFEKLFAKTIYPKAEYDGFYIAVLKRTV